MCPPQRPGLTSCRDLPQSLGAYERAMLALAVSGRHAKAVLLLSDVEAAGLVVHEEIYGEIIRACGKVRKVVLGERSHGPMRSIYEELRWSCPTAEQ